MLPWFKTLRTAQSAIISGTNSHGNTAVDSFVHRDIYYIFTTGSDRGMPSTHTGEELWR